MQFRVSSILLRVEMRITVDGVCLLPEKSCERPIFVIGQDGSNENKEKREALLTHQDSMVPAFCSPVQMLFVGSTYRQRQNGSEECALIIACQLAQHRLQNRLELEEQKTHNQYS